MGHGSYAPDCKSRGCSDEGSIRLAQCFPDNRLCFPAIYLLPTCSDE